MCKFTGCVKNPYYNFKGEKYAKYCNSHKEDEMINVLNKLCEYDGCKKQSNYNFEGQIGGKYCASHKKNEMINVKKNPCQFIECRIIPSYNFEGEKYAKYCNSHKEDGMVNIKNKICQFIGCRIIPSYNFEGEKYAKYCNSHKEDGMINVLNKLCEYDGCKKCAGYNFKGQITKKFCASHKEDGMIDFKHKFCEFDGCKKCAGYNFEGKKYVKFCATHKEYGMIDFKHKFCEFEGCKIKSSFNFMGEKHVKFCAFHKENGMIDVTKLNKICKTYLCEKRFTNINYEGYCLRCFIHMFPEKPVVHNYKTKEFAVVEFVKSVFPDFTWCLDRKIKDGCSRRRPDLLLDLGYQVIIVEVDENQHMVYDCSCENKRIMQLSQDVGHRPMIFIRFNPDDYTDQNDKNITSCWGTNQKGICIVKKLKIIEWNDRLKVLQNQIAYWTNPENKTNKMVETIQLFYDCKI